MRPRSSDCTSLASRQRTRVLTLPSQNRSRRPRRKWLRGRRKHVRQESQATTRGGSRVLLGTRRLVSHHPCQWYRHAHAKDMPLRAIARLIQTMLYAQRFFPYYVYNILGGIEEDGTSISPSHRHQAHAHGAGLPGSGAVYSFDPVGSYEREACRAAGAAQSLVQPFLDNQVCSLRPILGHSHMAHPILTRLTPVFPLITDILQEPAGSSRSITPSTPPAIRRPRYRHRFLHWCNRAPHRGAFLPCFAPPRVLILFIPFLAFLILLH